MGEQRVVKWINLINKGITNAFKTIKDLNERRNTALKELERLVSKKTYDRSLFARLVAEYLRCIGTDSDESKENKLTLRGLAHRLGRGIASFSRLLGKKEVRDFAQLQKSQLIKTPGFSLSVVDAIVQMYGKQINPLLAILAEQTSACQAYLAKPGFDVKLVNTLLNLRGQETALFSGEEYEESGAAIKKIGMDIEEYKRTASSAIRKIEQEASSELGVSEAFAMLSAWSFLLICPTAMAAAATLSAISANAQVALISISTLTQAFALIPGMIIVKECVRKDLEPALKRAGKTREYKACLEQSAIFERFLTSVNTTLETF